MAVKKTIKQTTASFEQSERWVRVDENGNPIGEPKEVNVLVKNISRNGFAITYLTELIRLIDTIGNKKMKVVKYVLQKMDSNNKLTETTQEISEHCKVSRMTVNDTLKLLEEVGFIARKTGVVMLSPKIAHRGNAQRERYLLTKFYEMSLNEKPLPVENEEKPSE